MKIAQEKVVVLIKVFEFIVEGLKFETAITANTPKVYEQDL